MEGGGSLGYGLRYGMDRQRHMRYIVTSFSMQVRHQRELVLSPASYKQDFRNRLDVGDPPLPMSMASQSI